jgi:hypothetical protein
MVPARPDAIFLGATTAAAIDFVKRYRQAGGTALIDGTSMGPSHADWQGNFGSKTGMKTRRG